MVESGQSALALIIADMSSPPHVSDFELGLATPPDHADICRATEDARLRSYPSPRPIGGANSRLHFWQPFLPSLRVLGCDNCSPTNLACRKTACSDLTTDSRQTNIVLTRELTERIGLLHTDSFRDAWQNTYLSGREQD
jgi:hypothetical protein